MPLIRALINPFGLRPGSDPALLDGGPRNNLRPASPRRRNRRLTPAARSHQGAAMNDLLVIGITIVIFAALFLLVRVVEHLER